MPKGTRNPKHIAAMVAGRRRQRAERPLAVRLWEKIEKRGADECWPWRGAIAGNGYGQVCLYSYKQPNGKWQSKLGQPHRVAWETHNGRPVPDGMVIDHICRNTVCCNPMHLRPVLQSDNCTILARGNPFGENRKKTHCNHGHPLSGDNIVWHQVPRDKRPTRQCVACRPWLVNSRYKVNPPLQT